MSLPHERPKGPIWIDLSAALSSLSPEVLAEIASEARSRVFSGETFAPDAPKGPFLRALARAEDDLVAATNLLMNQLSMRAWGEIFYGAGLDWTIGFEPKVA